MIDMMKKYLILVSVMLLGWSVTAGAQRLGVREEVRADWNKSSGLDCLVDPSLKAQTPVPKGYEAVYISHYGRHGSRYASTADAYTIILNMLSEGGHRDRLEPASGDCPDDGDLLPDRVRKGERGGRLFLRFGPRHHEHVFRLHGHLSPGSPGESL